MTNVTPPGGRGDGFHDHFSAVAGDYARHRPTYPAALFDWLATLPASRSHAWDCGTGSGQAARELGKRFDRVTATDASAEQLARAVPAENVEYRQATAEESGLEDASVDLVTAAQAVHWFDLERFWPEVRRVLVDGGLVAVWSYELFSVDAAVDRVVWRLYRDVVGEHWPPERKIVETGYRDLWFPFEEIEVPELEMVAEWDLERVLGYLRTWSASKRWAEAHGGRDPVRMVREELVEAWGKRGGERILRWPLVVRVGRPGSG